MTIYGCFTDAQLFASIGLDYAYQHSDAVGQCIVVALFISSVLIWMLMITKFIQLKKDHIASLRTFNEMKMNKNPMMLLRYAQNPESPCDFALAACCKKMAELYGSEETLQMRNRRPLTEPELELVRAAMEEEVTTQLMLMDKSLIWIMTAISAAPFLGLFGTVWGIMIAFVAMAMQGKPDVSTLAPGISGALLTTVLGLFVALPSLFGYNMITNYIKHNTIILDNFSETVITKLRQEQLAVAKQPVQHQQIPQN